MAISPNPGDNSGAGAAAVSVPPGGPAANQSQRQMSLSRRPAPSLRPRSIWRAVVASLSLRRETSRRRHSRDKSVIASTAHRNSLLASNDESLLPPSFDDKVRDSGHSGGGTLREGSHQTGPQIPEPYDTSPASGWTSNQPSVYGGSKCVVIPSAWDPNPLSGICCLRSMPKILILRGHCVLIAKAKHLWDN